MLTTVRSGTQRNNWSPAPLSHEKENGNWPCGLRTNRRVGTGGPLETNTAPYKTGPKTGPQNWSKYDENISFYSVLPPPPERDPSGRSANTPRMLPRGAQVSLLTSRGMSAGLDETSFLSEMYKNSAFSIKCAYHTQY